VQHLFDGFARSFDTQLQALGYRAPELIGTALATAGLAAASSLSVLDAGCGTGLCGPWLRPYSKRLVGVDLSPRMLAKARLRGAHDQLVEAELTDYMAAHPGSFDVIASADTFIYFGSLEPVLGAAAIALVEDGVLAFTLEQATATTQDHGYALTSNGRYRHRRDYVTTALSSQGLQVVTVAEDALRSETGTPVAGLVVTARRGRATHTDS
jgi:predicted TPR repeat methyltransferase